MSIFSRLMLIAMLALLAYCLVLGCILGLLQIPEANRNPVIAVTLIGLVAVVGTKKARRMLTSGGTAAWASVGELSGMLRAKHGLILGRVAGAASLWGALKSLLNPTVRSADACREFFNALDKKKRNRGQILRLPQAVHTAVFAPTGVGKGVSLIIPFLMTCEESCVVIDFKGENAKLTAERRRKLGHRVVILDPFRVVTQKPDTFNPFDPIDPASPTALDDCRDIAEALVVRTGEEKDQHWNDTAEDMIGGIAATTVIYGQRDKGTRSLHEVGDLLSHPQKLEMAKKLMQQHGGLLGQWGGRLDHIQGDEKNSVLSTTNRFLRFLGTPAVVESTSSSSFDPSMLKRGKMTVYLVLPPERMRAQSALLRLWIGAMFRAVIQCGLNEKNKVHFILDEAATLGHMQQLDDAVDKYRGYGIKLQFYYQSQGQLKTCWPKDQGQTLLSNTTQIFFGVNDFQAAEAVSKRLGNQTILVEGWGGNRGWGRNQSTSSGGHGSQSYGTSQSGGSSSDHKQQTRELLKPDEVLTLDPRVAIILTPGVRPIWSRLLRYYEEKELFRNNWWKQTFAAVKIFLRAAALLLLVLLFASLLTVEVNNVVERQRSENAQIQFRPR